MINTFNSYVKFAKTCKLLYGTIYSQSQTNRNYSRKTKEKEIINMRDY